MHAALRRRRGGDAAARRKGGAAKIGDREPVDLQSAGVHFQPRAQVARIKAGDGGMADIGGDRHIVRACDIGAGEQRVAEAKRGVDIELGRLERGIEPRRVAAGGEDIGEVAGNRFAVEFGGQALDRDLVAAKRELAAQAHWPQVALPRGRMALQPRGQCFRIVGLDLGRTGEGDALVVDREMAAQAHLREAGRAKFEAVEIPSLGVGADVAAQILHRVAAERGLVDADADLDRDFGAEGAGGQLRELANGGGRRQPAAVGPGQRAIEIDLAARQHAVEARMLAELEIRHAGQLEALVRRAVLEFELLHQRRRRRRLDLAAQAPGLAQRAGAARGDADRPRQAQAALETRRTGGERERAVGFGAERMTDRIDIDTKLELAVVAVAAGGEPKRIEFAADACRALALERAEQRARLAVEPEMIERDAALIGGVAERQSAVLDAEAVDGQRIGVKADRQIRRLQMSRGVETEP